MNVFPDLVKLIILNILLMLILQSCNYKNEKRRFYYPADFDPVRSTCFIWSENYYEIIPKLAGVISQKDKVTFYYHESEADSLLIYNVLQKYQSNLKNINLLKLNNKPVSNWIRDFGPVYMINDAGAKKLIDFGHFSKRIGFAKEIGTKTKLPIIESYVNSSGGARETNGRGTMILCETHELDVNKPKTKSDIETELKDKLEITNIIWLKKGVPQDDSRLNGPLIDQIYPNGVNGHVDQFCRFANAQTILISSVTEEEAKLHPILAEAKNRLDENFNILLNSTDQDGKKFKLIKVPFAPLLFIERSIGDKRIFVTPVTSYMNFIITNSIIILPSYKEEQNNDILIQNKEKEVEEIFKKAFPTREIIKVQASGLNYFSGGFHCISINEPLAIK